MIKLNLGCGRDIRSGFVNLDSVPLPGVDVVHDVESAPLPFGDDTFDEIRCKSILEHVDYIQVLKELHRIVKPGGRIDFVMPHFTCAEAYVDPTHKWLFACGTMDFFVAGHKRNYYFDFSFSKIDRRITFEKEGRFFFYNRILEKIVNASRGTQEFYERTPLRMFPAQSIRGTLFK